MRTGAQYTESLRDGRQVLLDGERVPDVSTHPAFSGAVRTVAAMYDMAADAANADLMTYSSASSGRSAHRAWSVPRSSEELRVRHAALEAWAEMNLGLMGRTPDLGASFLAAFAGAAEFFGDRAANVLSFVERAREESLYVSYAIVPPQIDRSRPAHKQDDVHAYAGVSAEKDGGVVVRGAQMLGTGTAISDYVLLSCIHPLVPGDEAYANCMVIPVSAPGVKVYSRRSYAAANHGRDDYPLSCRFDETDSLLVFDDVFVPWEDVFVYRDVDLTRDQWFATSAHALGNHQSQVRFATKLRATVGALLEVVDSGGSDPLDRLPRLQALATAVDATVLAGEVRCEIDPWGVAGPGRPELYAVMALQSQIAPEASAAAREILGEEMLVATAHAGPDGTAAPWLSSPGLRARQLAWDLVGSEFAGRQQQYELFYAGAPFVVRRQMARAYDSGRARQLASSVLRSGPQGGS